MARHPVPPPVPLGKSIDQYPAVVRILLAEGFDSTMVSGARRSENLSIEVTGGQIQLQAVTQGEKGRILESASGFRLEPARGRFLTLGGFRYRGVIDVFINPVGIPVAVNEVDREEYLRGVVPNELGPHEFPQLEAQKAQAVAARTFTLKHLNAYARFGFDLYGDQRSQVYTGVDSEHPLSDQAIRDTQGVAATFRGDLIWAFYCSTCGGKTEAFHEIFKGPPVEYLLGGASCHDEASPYHSWEDNIEIREIQSGLDQYAAVGRLRRLDPLRRSEAGRLVEMRFQGDERERVLKGNEIRFALGLKSNFLTALNPVTDDAGYICGIRVRGKGWGHGVGMCQMGAVDLARRGENYEQILKYYYKAIDLTIIQ